MRCPPSPSLQSLAVALSTLALAACGSSGSANAGGSGGGITCPGTQVYNARTNKCVDSAADAGTVGDSTASSSSSSSSGGGSSGASSGGEPDIAEKELPWQIDDGGGIVEPDTGDNYINACPQKAGSGKQHTGQKCDQHEDCLYGYCLAGGFLTGYNDSIKFCARNTFCSGGGSCGDENGNGVLFSAAQEMSKSGHNPKRTSEKPWRTCARSCKTDSDCAKWNAELPHCLKSSTKYVSVGTIGVCARDPDK